MEGSHQFAIEVIQLNVCLIENPWSTCDDHIHLSVFILQVHQNFKQTLQTAVSNILSLLRRQVLLTWAISVPVCILDTAFEQQFGRRKCVSTHLKVMHLTRCPLFLLSMT